MGYPLVNSHMTMENIGKSPFLMGKLTISMAIFDCFLYVYRRVPHLGQEFTSMEGKFSAFADGFPGETWVFHTCVNVCPRF